MDNEKALQALTEIFIIACWGAPNHEKAKEYNETLQMAHKALEKQAPKAPEQDKRKGLEAYCPVCGAYVGWIDALASDISPFCSECGQAISDRRE